MRARDTDLVSRIDVSAVFNQVRNDRSMASSTCAVEQRVTILKVGWIIMVKKCDVTTDRVNNREV